MLRSIWVFVREALIWLTAGAVAIAMMLSSVTMPILASIAIVPIAQIFSDPYLKSATTMMAFLGMFWLMMNLAEVAVILCAWQVRVVGRRWWSYIKVARFERLHGVTYEPAISGHSA